ncbi:MAG: alanine racemase [Bacteroidia bacterium]|nr:alanine racemase [Bacteroidia bacterium]MDW8134707.1 alanine racemase [Bacteroidia bacterium]
MVELGRSWSGAELAQILGGIPSEKATELELKAIAWDTRRMHSRIPSLFIALRGARDGHAYIPQAFKLGALLCLTEQPLEKGLPYIQVKDTWEALFRWAKVWRDSLPYPIVGITGKLGKTWVKEWLAYLLEGQFRIVRSPGSFNSRLGVPLSLLTFPPQAEIGLIEVAISHPQEMPPMGTLVEPEYGVLTSLGGSQLNAQAYLPFFHKSRWLSVLWEDSVSVPFTRMYRVGPFPEGDFGWEKLNARGEGYWHLPDGGKVHLKLPEGGQAVWQNAILAASVAYLLGCKIEYLKERLASFPPLPQRLHWVYDVEGRFWLNDTYHADFTSIGAALDEFQTLPITPKTIILTDFPPYTKEAHERVVDRLKGEFSPEQVHLIGPIFHSIGWGNTYQDREAFLRTASLRGKAFLIKGSRRYKMEEVLSHLTGYGLAPELKMDWEKIYRNLTHLRTHLPPTTRILAMLKAEAYGGGDLLMANFLQRQGVDYIGVAYTQEALRLRSVGITLPILVFYPSRESVTLFKEKGLEAAVGTWDALKYWAGEEVPIHVEFDIGMGRMGFLPEELSAVIELLQQRSARVKGLFSHLPAPERPQDSRVKLQLKIFSNLYSAFKSVFPQATGHLLNTAGILHIGASAAYDMVRVGIGLYGIGPELEEATALYAPIIRIQSYAPGTYLNYSFRSSLPQGGRVATVALGYGDGLMRDWAEKGGYVFVQGYPAPILPPLNMDLMLIKLPPCEVEVGDKVEVWGPSRSLAQLASEMGTSPYEVIVRLSHRVRRVYTWGGI